MASAVAGSTTPAQIATTDHTPVIRSDQTLSAAKEWIGTIFFSLTAPRGGTGVANRQANEFRKR
jgi:hypothetical protein